MCEYLPHLGGLVGVEGGKVRVAGKVNDLFFGEGDGSLLVRTAPIKGMPQDLQIERYIRGGIICTGAGTAPCALDLRLRSVIYQFS